MTKHCFHFLLPLLALLLFSCKPTVPGEYIQPGEMEDILYDYYVAKAAAEASPIDVREYNQRLYTLAVFKKHGVTEAEFDSSMVYYTRHADKLYDIYKSLSGRLEKDAVAYGATVSEINKYGGLDADTANVWQGERSIVLMRHAPYNISSYTIKTDSTFHKGDRVILSFDTRFIQEDGSRDGVALLSLRFANDSVASRNIHVSADTHYSLDISDAEGLGIKEIKGFFYLANGMYDTKTTLKLLSITNITLVNQHNKISERKQQEAEPKDTAATARPADSVVSAAPAVVHTRKLPPPRPIVDGRAARPLVEPARSR